MLENRAVAIERDGCRFWLAGIGDFAEGRSDLDRALAAVPPDGGPILALTHNPDLFPTLPRRVDLLVAGHTHGGQVHWPLLGRPIVPSRYGDRYAAGAHFENGHMLFVSTGLGTSILPVRFRVPPEISLLQLLPQTAGPARDRTSQSTVGSGASRTADRPSRSIRGGRP